MFTQPQLQELAAALVVFTPILLAAVGERLLKSRRRRTARRTGKRRGPPLKDLGRDAGAALVGR